MTQYGPSFTDASDPSSLRGRGASYMGQLALLAGHLALATWPERLHHIRLFHFIDSDSAAACLVKVMVRKRTLPLLSETTGLRHQEFDLMSTLTGLSLNPTWPTDAVDLITRSSGIWVGSSSRPRPISISRHCILFHTRVVWSFVTLVARWISHVAFEDHPGEQGGALGLARGAKAKTRPAPCE